MIDAWRKMATADRRRVQVLIGCALIAVYAPVYLLSSKDLFQSKKDLNRLKDRFEKRTSLVDMEGGGISTKIIERRIEKVEERLKVVSNTIKELDVGFAPVDSSEVQQELKLEISTLADRSGIELLSVSRRGSHSEEQFSTKVFLDKVSGRPLLDVKAKADFGQLLRFLTDLRELSYHVSVMNIKISTLKSIGGSDVQIKATDSSLYINLILSL